VILPNKKMSSYVGLDDKAKIVPAIKFHGGGVGIYSKE